MYPEQVEGVHLSALLSLLSHARNCKAHNIQEH